MLGAERMGSFGGRMLAEKVAEREREKKRQQHSKSIICNSIILQLSNKSFGQRKLKNKKKIKNIRRIANLKRIKYLQIIFAFLQK